jgi:dipeptidyl aminopeptidase/acylaminoacyl peptidase
MRSILPVVSAFMAASRSAGGAAHTWESTHSINDKVDVILMDTHQCTKLFLMRFFSKLAAAVLATPTLAGAPAFTIDQAISAPFPSELAASPAGGKVAWVFDENGARNVWVAEAPAYRGHRLTNYRGDDGQDITDVTWSLDGRYIAYVRGGGPNSRGEIPNPAHDPKGARQVVYVVAAAGGEPRDAGDGVTPAVSRDRVFFAHSGQIMAAPIEGSGKAVQLVRGRGQADDLRISPDGTRLAWVSSRGDHAFIGVYDVPAASLVYLDPSVDTDSEPAWSPDSRQVAFVRRAAGGREWGPHRTAQPWSIRVADAATGRGHELWKAEAGPGSAFRGMGSEMQLFWAEGERMVFPWERDGWLHLYSIPLGGGAPTLLTPGAFEVEHAALGPGRREMIYSSNQGDIDRRHIWRVGAAGGAPTAVTSGSGIEVYPVVTGEGAVAFLRSGARTPLRPALRAGSEAVRDLAPDALPAEFPRAALIEPQQVVFPSGDGLEIHGQLFAAKGGAAARKPALIFFHGGSRRQMLLGWHYMYYYSNAYALNQYFASQGYVVLSVNYRSGIGYGLNFREALNYGATGGAEFSDVLAAGLYLRSRGDVDSSRIGLWGGSYGGYLTALGLARASGQFAAGVDFHGVHDWSTELGGLGAEAARVAWESSPMASVKDWRSPVLLIHGDDDRNVKFSQTVDLVQALRRQKVEFEELIFPDEIHDFLMHRHWLDAYRAAADFFARKLGNREAANGRLE